MAFDMHAGPDQATIDHHEVYVFELAGQDPERFQQLCKLYAEFYKNPNLTPEVSGQIVHELIDLMDTHGGQSKSLNMMIHRLLPFFSRAFRQRQPIRCASD